jgi:hypothetical protein
MAGYWRGRCVSYSRPVISYPQEQDQPEPLADLCGCNELKKKRSRKRHRAQTVDEPIGQNTSILNMLLVRQLLLSLDSRRKIGVLVLLESLARTVVSVLVRGKIC